MRHLLASLFLGCLVACVADNPAYVPGSAGDLAGASHADLTSGPGSPDLTSGPGSPDLTSGPGSPDLATPPVCKDGARRCNTDAQGQIYSQACHASAWVNDRACPTDSTCKQGYCQVPPHLAGTPAGQLCTTEDACTLATLNPNYSCEPFVISSAQGLTVQTYCAVAVGAGVPGTTCTPDDGATCRSGFCDDTVHNNMNYCLRRCVGVIDCPHTNVTFTCSPAQTTVEGQPLMITSCIPS